MNRDRQPTGWDDIGCLLVVLGVVFVWTGLLLLGSWALWGVW